MLPNIWTRKWSHHIRLCNRLRKCNEGVLQKQILGQATPPRLLWPQLLEKALQPAPHKIQEQSKTNRSMHHDSQGCFYHWWQESHGKCMFLVGYCRGCQIPRAQFVRLSPDRKGSWCLHTETRRLQCCSRPSRPSQSLRDLRLSPTRQRWSPTRAESLPAQRISTRRSLLWLNLSYSLLVQQTQPLSQV